MKENYKDSAYFQIEYNLQSPQHNILLNRNEFQQYYLQVNTFYEQLFYQIQNNIESIPILSKLVYNKQDLKEGNCALVSLDLSREYKDIIQIMNCTRRNKEVKLKSLRYNEEQLKDRPSLNLRIIKYGNHPNSKTSKKYDFMLLHILSNQQNKNNNLECVNEVKKSQPLKNQVDEIPSLSNQQGIQSDGVSKKYTFMQSQIYQEQNKNPNSTDYIKELSKKRIIERQDQEEIPIVLDIENKKQQILQQNLDQKYQQSETKQQQSIPSFISQNNIYFEKKEFHINQPLISDEIQKQEKQYYQLKDYQQEVFQKEDEKDIEDQQLKLSKELKYYRIIAEFDQIIASLKKQKQKFKEENNYYENS